MSKFIYRRLAEQGWLQADQRAERSSILGAIIRIETTDRRYCVAEPLGMDENLKLICEKLNVAAITTMSSDITTLVFTNVNSADGEIALSPSNVTVPVVNSLHDLALNGCGVTRRDLCCFVREERVVLVWSISPDELILNCTEVESKLMSCVILLFSTQLSKD